jgi:hypothetical protein
VNNTVIIGSADKTFIKVNKTFAGYNITSATAYNVAVDGFGAGSNYTFVNTTLAHATNNTNEA